MSQRPTFPRCLSICLRNNLVLVNPKLHLCSWHTSFKCMNNLQSYFLITIINTATTLYMSNHNFQIGHLKRWTPKPSIRWSHTLYVRRSTYNCHTSALKNNRIHLNLGPRGILHECFQMDIGPTIYDTCCFIHLMLCCHLTPLVCGGGGLI